MLDPTNMRREQPDDDGVPPPSSRVAMWIILGFLVVLIGLRGYAIH
jgi:hypothetical protein